MAVMARLVGSSTPGVRPSHQGALQAKAQAPLWIAQHIEALAAACSEDLSADGCFVQRIAVDVFDASHSAFIASFGVSAPNDSEQADREHLGAKNMQIRTKARRIAGIAHAGVDAGIA
eukprot:2841269-Alexandrium_andersonii.AAC.1